MMEVKAVIRPNKLPALRTALMETPGFPGMTVAKVEGCSAPSKVSKANIKDELTDYSAKVRVEIVSGNRDDDAGIIKTTMISVSSEQEDNSKIKFLPNDFREELSTTLLNYNIK